MAGQLVHFEIEAKDTDRATAFYSSVFGWSFGDSGMPGIDYRMTRTGEAQGGAVYASDKSGTRPLVYFDSDDIDASIAKVREAGGEAPDKQPIPGVGWFTHAKDTEGNEIGIFQSDESVQAPG
jgi:predicted enzyme related to lactoylglutathione lyase